MSLKRNDISTWNKTAALLYMEENYQMAKDLLELEVKNLKRPYHIKRIIGRMRRLYRKDLVHNCKETLKGIKPTKMQDIEKILANETDLRAYFKLKETNLKQLLSFLKYEHTHKDRIVIKKVLATRIIQKGEYGIRKKY